jgi:glycosyltransferase involved in cell wall biosynthesis
VWNRVRGYDLLIAGGGTYAEHLKRQARGNDRIRFLGPLSQAELGAVYYHALAVLVPSITYETFGVIIIEAFARKTPVIVRDLGALPEVVRDSGGGFIYQTDEELLQFIKNIGASQAYRNELGEKGYVAFRRHWTRQAHLKMYDHFLRRAALNKYGHIPWDDAGETPVVPGKSAKAIT